MYHFCMAWPKGRPRSPETIAKIKSRVRPIEERYWDRVDKRGPDECWPWTGNTMKKLGYGVLSISGRERELAHRFGWRLVNGDIPSGFVVDHDCHNKDLNCAGGVCPHRGCQNPSHLRLATNAENVMAGRGFGKSNAEKTHCKEGHILDGGNTYVRLNGWRDCRRCKADAQLRYVARKKKRGSDS